MPRVAEPRSTALPGIAAGAFGSASEVRTSLRALAERIFPSPEWEESEGITDRNVCSQCCGHYHSAVGWIFFFFLLFFFFFHQPFHSLRKVFRYLNRSALFQLLFFVLFYLIPFSCFHLKSDRFGGALNCFPLEAESSPECLSDVPHYPFGTLKPYSA